MEKLISEQHGIKWYQTQREQQLNEKDQNKLSNQRLTQYNKTLQEILDTQQNLLKQICVEHLDFSQKDKFMIKEKPKTLHKTKWVKFLQISHIPLLNSHISEIVSANRQLIMSYKYSMVNDKEILESLIQLTNSDFEIALNDFCDQMQLIVHIFQKKQGQKDKLELAMTPLFQILNRLNKRANNLLEEYQYIPDDHLQIQRGQICVNYIELLCKIITYSICCRDFKNNLEEFYKRQIMQKYQMFMETLQTIKIIKQKLLRIRSEKLVKNQQQGITVVDQYLDRVSEQLQERNVLGLKSDTKLNNFIYNRKVYEIFHKTINNVNFDFMFAVSPEILQQIQNPIGDQEISICQFQNQGCELQQCEINGVVPSGAINFGNEKQPWYFVPNAFADRLYEKQRFELGFGVVSADPAGSMGCASFDYNNSWKGINCYEVLSTQNSVEWIDVIKDGMPPESSVALYQYSQKAKETSRKLKSTLNSSFLSGVLKFGGPPDISRIISTTAYEDEDVITTQYLARYTLDYKDKEKSQDIVAVVEAKDGILDSMTIYQAEGRMQKFTEHWQCQILTIPQYEKSFGHNETVFNLSGSTSIFGMSTYGKSNIKSSKFAQQRVVFEAGKEQQRVSPTVEQNNSFNALLDKI